jgi:hypothetical protein
MFAMRKNEQNIADSFGLVPDSSGCREEGVKPYTMPGLHLVKQLKEGTGVAIGSNRGKMRDLGSWVIHPPRANILTCQHSLNSAVVDSSSQFQLVSKEKTLRPR